MEVSTKCGLDPSGVWGAAGFALLQAGDFPGAREKFARCMKVNDWLQFDFKLNSKKNITIKWKDNESGKKEILHVLKTKYNQPVSHCVNGKKEECRNKPALVFSVLIGSNSIVISPSSNTYFDWRRMRHVSWVKTP